METSMVYESVKDQSVRAILDEATLTREDRIRKLTRLRDDARADQRLASEAPAVDDDGMNSTLRDVERVLEYLGRTPAGEGKGPASL
jgi:hypothetical protein